MCRETPSRRRHRRAPGSAAAVSDLSLSRPQHRPHRATEPPSHRATEPPSHRDPPRNRATETPRPTEKPSRAGRPTEKTFSPCSQAASHRNVTTRHGRLTAASRRHHGGITAASRRRHGITAASRRYGPSQIGLSAVLLTAPLQTRRDPGPKPVVTQVSNSHERAG